MIRWELDPRRCALLGRRPAAAVCRGVTRRSRPPKAPTVLENDEQAVGHPAASLGVPVIYTAHRPSAPTWPTSAYSNSSFPPMKDGMLSSGTEGRWHRRALRHRAAGTSTWRSPRFGAFTGTDLELIPAGQGNRHRDHRWQSRPMCAARPPLAKPTTASFKVVFPRRRDDLGGVRPTSAFGALTPRRGGRRPPSRSSPTPSVRSPPATTSLPRLRHSATDAPVRT